MFTQNCKHKTWQKTSNSSTSQVHYNKAHAYNWLSYGNRAGDWHCTVSTNEDSLCTRIEIRFTSNPPFQFRKAPVSTLKEGDCRRDTNPHLNRVGLENCDKVQEVFEGLIQARFDPTIRVATRWVREQKKRQTPGGVDDLKLTKWTRETYCTMLPTDTKHTHTWHIYMLKYEQSNADFSDYCKRRDPPLSSDDGDCTRRWKKDHLWSLMWQKIHGRTLRGFKIKNKTGREGFKCTWIILLRVVYTKNFRLKVTDIKYFGFSWTTSEWFRSQWRSRENELGARVWRMYGSADGPKKWIDWSDDDVTSMALCYPNLLNWSKLWDASSIAYDDILQVGVKKLVTQK